MDQKENKNNKINERVKLGLIEGKAKLDTKDFILLWEEKENATLLTKFNLNGEILEQEPIAKNKAKTYALEYCKKNNLDFENVDFLDISINKACPYCNSKALKRIAEDAKRLEEIPVMPLYLCSKCNKKSFCLTDKYLTFLMANNLMLFSAAERESIKNKKDETLREIRESAKRIFIAKGIKHVV